MFLNKVTAHTSTRCSRIGSPNQWETALPHPPPSELIEETKQPRLHLGFHDFSWHGNTHRSLTTGRPFILSELATRGSNAHHLPGEVYQLGWGQLRDFPRVSNEEPERRMLTMLSHVFIPYSSSRTYFWCQRTWGFWPSNGEVFILTTTSHTPDLLTHPYGVQMARRTSALWFQLRPLVVGTLAGCEQKGHLSCKKLWGLGNPWPIPQLRLHRCSCQLRGHNLGGIT